MTSACAASSPRSGSAPSRLSSWAGAPTGSLSLKTSAQDVVSEHGEEAIERVKKLSGGFGVHSMPECVGFEQAMLTVITIARAGVQWVGSEFCKVMKVAA